jgi:signal transduction histidine kinase
VAAFILRYLEIIIKIVLALGRTSKQNRLAQRQTHRAAASNTIEENTDNQMEPQTPQGTNEMARLNAQVVDYEQKLADAATLVAHVRHEINNPLAALLGQAQLLLREELSERSRKRAETIESQAKRIQEIVGELREIQLPAAAVNRQT